MGHRTYVLDGDNERHGLCKDLGFTKEDRVENVRRVAEVSKLMIDAGLIVLATFISPYRADREMARTLFDDGEFFLRFLLIRHWRFVRQEIPRDYIKKLEREKSKISPELIRNMKSLIFQIYEYHRIMIL